jgi:hypothetical protein
MVEGFDWLSTLIQVIVSLALAIMGIPPVAWWLMRHWGSFCAFLRECRRSLLPGANSRRTPDPEEQFDDHGTELETLDADALPPPSPVLPSPPLRLNGPQWSQPPPPCRFPLVRCLRPSRSLRRPSPSSADAVSNFSRPLLRRSSRICHPTQFYGR